MTQSTGEGDAETEANKEWGREHGRERAGKKETSYREFIKIQGYRTTKQWDEIEDQLGRESFNLHGVVGRHLRDTEEPPIIERYFWKGCKRPKWERKEGGVGVLVCSQGWNRTSESYRKVYGQKVL